MPVFQLLGVGRVVSSVPSTSNSCISISISVPGYCVSASECCVAAASVSVSLLPKLVADSCVSATGCCVAASGVSISLLSTVIPVAGSCVSVAGWVAVCVSAISKSNDVWVSNSCSSISLSVAGSCVSAVVVSCVSAMAGSCVSATEWVTGSCVSATFCETDGVTVSGASDFCVATPMVRIGRGSGVGGINGLLGFSRIGGGFRVVVIQGGLIEDFVCFFHGKGGKGAICGRFRGGFSSMIGQGIFSGSESSIMI
jgi:hypothetical protein